MAFSQFLAALVAELATAHDLELLQGAADLQRYSRDYYDYSPILQPRLASCRDLVVRPLTVSGWNGCSSLRTPWRAADPAWFRNRQLRPVRSPGRGRDAERGLREVDTWTQPAVW